MKQILCLSHTSWQAQPNRIQQLMTRLADAQIIFVEPAPPRGAPKEEQGRRMRSHITVYTLPVDLPEGPVRTFGQRRNLNKAVAFLEEIMHKHHFRHPVLWCTSPDQMNLASRLSCRGIVYDCHREWDEKFLDLESELTSRADVVFAASPGLVTRLSPCSDNIALLPNGVNPLMFERGEYSPPDKLAALEGHVVLGRVGDITGHTDLKPLLAAATAQKNWVFLLMGRINRQAKEKLSRCKNIVTLGPINAVELPDYLSVCSILFELEETDRLGCDILPAKIYEYMASGKPIVMMAQPDYTEPFPDVIYTAYDHTGFLRRCHKALEEDPSAVRARRACANSCAWAVRAEEVTRILESTGLF